MSLSKSNPVLRVGLCIDRWDPLRGGAESALAQLATWLEARGHRVLVFARERPDHAQDAPGEFVAVRARGLTRGRRERNLGCAMLRAARELKCDVVVGVRHMENVDVLWPHGGTHVESLRAMGKRARGRHQTFLDIERTAIDGGGAQCIVCVSELIREEMLRHYPGCEERLEVIPNGVDLERFRVEARPQAQRELRELGAWEVGTPLLTFVARNPELKGLDLLLRSLSLLQEEPWKLVIAGPRDTGPVQRKVAQHLRNTSRVLVAEHLDSLTLAAGSDLLLLPSRRDPCPLVVLEALACGTPVLVSEAVGSKDAIQSEAHGAVFATDSSPEDLSKQIARRLQICAAGDFTREEIASAVAQRSLPAWLGGMEALLLAFAAGKGVSSRHE